MAQNTQHGRRENAGGNTADLKQRANEEFDGLTGRAADQLATVADAMEDVATRIPDQGRAAGQQLREVAGNISGAVDKSIKEQPMATLAAAAVIGFMLGALWKR
jgi:ElaB/YqjD/DUF883 family membrane-anchored ribosome-binding protein